MFKTAINFISIFFVLFFLSSCKDDVLPKPSGFLRLDYTEANYKLLINPKLPFDFEQNTASVFKENTPNGFSIAYPKMKATIYLTYKPVQNNIANLLRDAQKLTYEHVIKADDIVEQPYVNPSKKVYGMFYKVSGNAATSSQFYVTDSLKHFVSGSVYFYSKPNYDSILPAASYIQNDMQRIMETLVWK